MPGSRPKRPRYTSRSIVTANTVVDPAVQRSLQQQTEAINRLAGEQLVPQRGAEGNVYYRQANGDVVALPIGTQGQMLQVDDGVPVWGAAGGSATLADGDYGDVTVSGGGTVMSLDAGVVGTPELADNAVTNAKLADMPATTIKGNATGGAADPQDLSPAAVASMLGLSSPQGVVVDVDFGAAISSTEAATVVVGQPWVTASSIIIVNPAGAASADHDPEDGLIEQVSAIASDLVAGVGFTVYAHSPEGSSGVYRMWALGVA